MTVSIHADPTYDYPSYFGYDTENTETNYNFLFPKQCTWAEYKPLLQQALNAIVAFKPQVLVVAFGADTVDEDPDPSHIYGASLSVPSYREMGEMIGKLSPCDKIIVTQEGGYDLTKVPLIIDNLLTGIESGLDNNNNNVAAAPKDAFA